MTSTTALQAAIQAGDGAALCRCLDDLTHDRRATGAAKAALQDALLGTLERQLPGEGAVTELVLSLTARAGEAAPEQPPPSVTLYARWLLDSYRHAAGLLLPSGVALVSDAQRARAWQLCLESCHAGDFKLGAKVGALVRRRWLGVMVWCDRVVISRPPPVCMWAHHSGRWGDRMRPRGLASSGDLCRLAAGDRGFFHGARRPSPGPRHTPRHRSLVHLTSDSTTPLAMERATTSSWRDCSRRRWPAAARPRRRWICFGSGPACKRAAPAPPRPGSRAWCSAAACPWPSTGRRSSPPTPACRPRWSTSASGTATSSRRRPWCSAAGWAPRRRPAWTLQSPGNCWTRGSGTRHSCMPAAMSPCRHGGGTLCTALARLNFGVEGQCIGTA